MADLAAEDSDVHMDGCDDAAKQQLEIWETMVAMKVSIAAIQTNMVDMDVTIGEIKSEMREMRSSTSELGDKIDKNMEELTRLLAVLPVLESRGAMEQMEKVQTLEFKSLLAQALDEQQSSLQDMQTQMKELTGKTAAIETVVNGMCLRGRSLRVGGGGLMSSASAGSLPVPPYMTGLNASADAVLGGQASQTAQGPV